jgi:hypothetical protein
MMDINMPSVGNTGQRTCYFWERFRHKRQFISMRFRCPTEIYLLQSRIERYCLASLNIRLGEIETKRIILSIENIFPARLVGPGSPEIIPKLLQSAFLGLSIRCGIRAKKSDVGQICLPFCSFFAPTVEQVCRIAAFRTSEKSKWSRWMKHGSGWRVLEASIQA